MNITNNTKLETLRFYNNNVSYLDLSSNTNLKELDCLSNNITSLNLSNNLRLSHLNCGGNPLTELDIRTNDLLTYVYCCCCELNSLNIGNKPNLTLLTCYRNRLEELDVSGCSNLRDFMCWENNLFSLNVKNGNNHNMTSTKTSGAGHRMLAFDNPNLSCIEVDDPCASKDYNHWQKDEHAIYSSDCSIANYDIVSACESYTWIDGNTYTESNNSATYILTNDAGCDSVVTLDLTIQKSTFGVDTQSACNSYEWIDGITYYENNNTATYSLTNSVGCDSTVTLNLTILETTGVDVHSACDSYKWIDGKTYTKSNNQATYTLTNSAGCDSIVTLDITINKSTTYTDIQTACDSYRWIDGNTYYENNNTATHTSTNSSGCDLITTLDLTILNSTTGVDTHTACDSYEWIDGNTYHESNNTATYTLTNSLGCDSIVTLNLTILNSTYGVDVQTACDSYEWIDGNTYYQSNNTATYTLTNSLGCDSIVTLNLTILNSTSIVDYQKTCDPYTWIDGNTYYQSNNTATHVLTNGDGCDSIVALDLTILKSTSGEDTQVACDSYTWIDGQIYTENNNTATYTLTNAAGCDSIVTLNLNIVRIDKSLANNDSTIIAIQENADYQWLDCDNGYLNISGAKDQSYKISRSGNYAVEISQMGCIDTTDCFSLNLVGIIETNFENNITVYPNPTSGLITVELNSIQDKIETKIYDIKGRFIGDKTFIHTNNFLLDINEAPGTYFVEIKSDKKKATLRIIKE